MLITSNRDPHRALKKFSIAGGHPRALYNVFTLIRKYKQFGHLSNSQGGICFFNQIRGDAAFYMLIKNNRGPHQAPLQISGAGGHPRAANNNPKKHAEFYEKLGLNKTNILFFLSIFILIIFFNNIREQMKLQESAATPGRPEKTSSR